MKKVTVAIQGSIGSFHDQVATHFFDGELELVECQTFEESFSALADQKADYCVVAVENSNYGPINTNYKLIEDYRFKVVKEIDWKIELHLMALPGTRMEDIQEIHSHPVALGQCGKFLKEGIAALAVNAPNTAFAAREIAEGNIQNRAAIANAATAEIYGLEIIKPLIQDTTEDFTRFYLLERNTSPKNVLEIIFPTMHSIKTLKTTNNNEKH